MSPFLALAFLVEAADDICYAITDLEDSVDQELITPEAASEVLLPIAKKSADEKRYEGKSRVRWLRGYAIRELTNACARVFCQNIDAILDGSVAESLINLSSCIKDYDHLKQAVRDHAYSDRRVLAIEVAGYKVIGGLLDIFVPALLDPKKKYHSKLLGLFPASYLGASDNAGRRIDAMNDLTPYQRILAVTDYISGMTDSFAVSLLPESVGDYRARVISLSDDRDPVSR
jgi:dGTPase